MLKKIKSYMMPIAMIIGATFYTYAGALSFWTPYLIAIMLFITYCNISLKEIHFSRMHFWLLFIQIAGSILTYLLLTPIHPIVAQGAMICILAPTATSAPVITKMLGGSIESLTAYSLLSNLAIIIIAPILFSMIGETKSLDFISSLWIIFQKIFLLLFLPFICALLTNKFLPKLYQAIQKKQSLSFYLWSLALTIITGRTVQFIVEQQSPKYTVEATIAIIALIICISQFLAGRRLGNIYNNTVAGGQGLGQKNTILAIWMAQNYLNPISSIGPGAYVLWQNLVNSYQVWRKRKSL